MSAPIYDPHPSRTDFELPQLDTPSSVSPPTVVLADDPGQVTQPDGGSPDAVASVLPGVAEAVETMVTELDNDGRKYAQAFTKNKPDADDLYQDAWLAALLKLPQLRDVSKFRSWFFTIIRNRFLSVHRRKNQWESFHDELDQAAPSDGLSPEQQADLLSALDRLSSKQRRFIELYYLDYQDCDDVEKPMTLSDVAAIMGLSPETAAGLRKAALRALKTELLR